MIHFRIHTNLRFSILVLIAFSFVTNLPAQVLELDSLILVELYNTTNGPHWERSDNWLEGPVSTWRGVTVSDGRVMGLDLRGMGLSGNIPPSLGSLTHLRALSLADSLITGEIPPQLGNLDSLEYLLLAATQLNGAIPPELGNLITLERLVLARNQLAGSIPPELGSLDSLEVLHLSSNQLSGTIPFELGNLAQLRELNLYGNQLTGSLPPELGNLAQLQDMIISDNLLSGSVPPELGNLMNLRDLDLARNELTGPIPVELADLVNLEYLVLAGNFLTGSIPPDLADLGKLRWLFLNQNLLTGTIPPELGNLSNLTDLGLHRNQLTGAVPDEINQLTRLEYLCLHINQLSDLPNLDSLTALNWFWIYHNQFTFEDIEPNIDLADTNFIYAPQDSIGFALDTLLAPGDTILLSVDVAGSANQYQWLKDGVALPGATADTLLLGPLEPTDIGSYVCRIRNTIVTALTLYSRPARISLEGYQSAAARLATPAACHLYPAWPNPFNMAATIRYELPKYESVHLVIWDLLGREVIRLVNGYTEPGIHQVIWDGTNSNGAPCPSGIYIVRLETPGYQQSIKLVLLK